MWHEGHLTRVSIRVSVVVRKYHKGRREIKVQYLML